MNYNVLTIPLFDKQSKRLVKKYPSLKEELSSLILKLEINPQIGKAFGNNFFKIRLAIKSKSKGKSGGTRVITYIRIVKNVVYLASIFHKFESGAISDKELERIFKLIL